MPFDDYIIPAPALVEQIPNYEEGYRTKVDVVLQLQVPALALGGDDARVRGEENRLAKVGRVPLRRRPLRRRGISVVR